MLKKLLLLLTAISFITCTGKGPSKEPVINNTTTPSGDTIWASGYTPGNVQINKDFKFVGSQDRSDQRSTREYYTWVRDDGTFIYIVDWRSRENWSFSEDNDGLLGRKNDPNNPLLKHEPFQYSLWKGMALNSKKMVRKLGVEIPKCIASFQKNKMSPSRSAAFFVVFVEKTDCGYKGWGGIGKRFNDVITIK